MGVKTEFLIIGGDGDLAIRKLYPALYALEKANMLDSVDRVVGISRKISSKEDVLNRICSELEKKERFEKVSWQRFTNRLDMHSFDAMSVELLKQYKKLMGPCEQRIIYLAIPPIIFSGVCTALNEAGLVDSKTRLVLEKPLGTDKQSFLEIHNGLCQVFSEEQIYRIDHYLGKEAVQNLLALRFANTIFGSVWKGDLIDNVQITISEILGVEDRHDFYEQTGALRDMVQNHILQVLCLVAMELPVNKTAGMVRAEKLKVLQSLKPITLDEINNSSVRGQYMSGTSEGELVPGYKQEIGEDSDSNNETYVAIKAHIDNWRWSGVPFYLRTGKRLQSRCAEVVIQFKQPKHNIFPEQTKGLPGNQLRIRLQPDDGIELHFLNKQPGVGQLPMQNLPLNLHVSEDDQKHGFDAYARLILEVIQGDQTLFVSAAEVVASWDWIDQIIDNWNKAGSKAHSYTAGTMGPSQSVVMLAKDSREWLDLSR